jgi:hypothetical protein
MKTTKKSENRSVIVEAFKKAVGSLKHSVTAINKDEFMFEAYSPIDPGYIVVAGSVYYNHDSKNQKVWNIDIHRGM